MSEPSVAAPPFVVPLIGLPGAGKSTLAEALTARLGWRLLSRDAIRAALFPECRYSLAEKRGAFRALLTGVEVNCALGASSVIDGMTFSRRSDLDRVAEAAMRYGARLLPLWLDVPPHVARARIARDLETGAHVAADRDPALVDDVLGRFETPPSETAAIDASASAAEVLAAALEIIERARNPG